MKTIATFIKKELKRFFTDKRTLFAIFFPGLLIFILYSVMGSVISDGMDSMNTYDGAAPTIYIKNEPNEFKDLLFYEGDEKVDGKVNVVFDKKCDGKTNEEIIEMVRNKEIDTFILFDENFYSTMSTYNPTDPNATAPKVQIYYNSSVEASSYAYSRYQQFLNAFEFSISNKFDINPNLETKYDLATDEESSAMLLTMVGPMLLVLFIFTGTMGFCTESISGEKERGTIATLLASPARRSDIAIGKIIPLGIVSLCSSIASSIGLFASLPKLTGGQISISLSFGKIALIVLVVIATTLFFATLLAAVSTFAKSTKEASALSVPLMAVIMGVAMINMFSSSAATNAALYLIPVYNILQCLTGVFTATINPLGFILTIVSTLAYTAAGIFAISKMFGNEKIMFSK